MTVREALIDGTARLEADRIPSPHLTAEVLLAHSMGRDRAFLYAHPEDRVEEECRRRYLAMIGRRRLREPLQYITGVQEFYGRPFRVDRTVLIPRPETELVVDAVLELNGWRQPRILDVGTGSGCIATTLALEIPDSRVFASDLSPEAVTTARQNASHNQASVRFACADLLEAWQGPFEFIVCNPPYVSIADREGLQPEVGAWEPAIALFGDDSPTAFYRRLVSGAWARLAPGGHVVLEIGYTMEEPVRKLFGAEWRHLRFRTDLQGIPRVVTAAKPGGRPRSESGRAVSVEGPAIV